MVEGVGVHYDIRVVKEWTEVTYLPIDGNRMYVTSTQSNAGLFATAS